MLTTRPDSQTDVISPGFSALVQGINAASEGQITGAEQINTALQQQGQDQDQIIQQNAGSSEEMSLTAEELSAQAEQLQQAIAYFRVEKMEPGGGAGHATRKLHIQT